MPAESDSSFISMMVDTLGDVDKAPADAISKPAVAAVAPEAPATAEKPQGFAIPDSVTAALAGVEVKPDPAATEKDAAKPDEEWESKADDLFKTKQGEAWKNIKADLKKERTERAKFEGELSTLRQELAAAKSSGTAPTEELERIKGELEEVRKTKSEYESQLSLAKVEASPEYRESVGKIFESVKAQATDLATKYDVPADSILKALNETDGTKQDALLAEITTGFQERDRIRLYGLIETQALANGRDKTIRENAGAAAQLIEERRKAAVEAHRAELGATYVKEFDNSVLELQEAIPFLKPQEGQTEWNGTVQGALDFAKSIDVDALNPKDRGKLVIQGVVTPLLVEMVRHYAGELTKRDQRLAKFEKSTPSAGGGSTAAPGKVADNVSFLDRLNSLG